MKKPYESIRVFESPFLERFTHVHPITPLIFWSPVVAFLIWHGFTVRHLSAYSMGGMAAVGFFVWTITEYLLHRFIFHFNAVGPTQEKLQFIIHGLHHADPQDPTRLVMPPFAGVVLACIFYSIFLPFVGAHMMDPFFGGFMVGYLCYDYIHYSVHHFKPRTRLGKYLKQSHMVHHFVSHNARWGVSTPLWDYFFGTMDESESESVRHGS